MTEFETPAAFIMSPENQLVWQRMQEIAATSSLTFNPSTQQATLIGAPHELSSTTRVFRHKFRTAKPNLLVREDVFHFGAGLSDVAAWTTHMTPVFQAVRTDDLQLLGRILDAVGAFAAARAA